MPANQRAEEAMGLVEARECRRCADCEDQEHHWNYYGDEDEAGEPVMSCKHCNATRPIEEDDQ